MWAKGLALETKEASVCLHVFCLRASLDTSGSTVLPNFFYSATRRLGQFAPAVRLALRELAIETFLPADALPAAAMQPLVTVSLNPYAP